MNNISWETDNNIAGCKIHKASINNIDIEIETSKKYQYDKYSGHTGSYNKHCLYIKYLGDDKIRYSYEPKNQEYMFFPLFTTLKQVKQKAILIANELLEKRKSILLLT